MPGLLSAAALTRDVIERLIASATSIRDGERMTFPDALVGLAFFEESLRTRVGFEAAAARLHARSVTVLGLKQTPAMWAPETLDDSIRSIAPWCDVLCLRHPDDEAVRTVAGLVETPVINCGNGSDEHPTQALVDVFAISEALGAVDGARIALVGDLHSMRAAHSLALALSQFEGVEVRCIAPAGLELPERFMQPLRAAGHSVVETTEMVVDDLDVVYVAGLPAETRVGTLSADHQARYRIDAALLGTLDARTQILCPLPRVDEIAADVDTSSHARYFQQGAESMYMRQALLAEILGGRLGSAGGC